MDKTKTGPFIPLPVVPTVLVGVNVGGRPNYLAVGFVSGVNIRPPILCVSLNRKHHSIKGLLENGTFSVNIPSADHVRETDYCGLVSGRSVDKSSIFTTFYGELGTAPMIEEFPIVCECRYTGQSMDFPMDTVYFGQVVQSYVNRDLYRKGKPADILKINPLLTGLDRRYRLVGEAAGKSFSIGWEYAAERQPGGSAAAGGDTEYRVGGSAAGGDTGYRVGGSAAGGDTGYRVGGSAAGGDTEYRVGGSAAGGDTGYRVGGSAAGGDTEYRVGGYAVHACRIVTRPPRHVLFTLCAPGGRDTAAAIGKAFVEIARYAAAQGAEPVDGPFILRDEGMGPDAGPRAGFVFATALPGRGRVESGKISGGRFAECLHTGPYERMGETVIALQAFIRENGFRETGIVYEFYRNDPAKTPPDRLETLIVAPVKRGR